MATPQRFDAAKLLKDLDGRGWLPRDLARAAGLSPATVSRVLSGDRQNPRTWKRLAEALGHSVRRYRVEPETAVAS